VVFVTRPHIATLAAASSQHPPRGARRAHHQHVACRARDVAARSRSPILNILAILARERRTLRRHYDHHDPVLGIEIVH
jgi:hypothetical protein